MSESTNYPVSDYGGKGAVLLHLKDQGFPVPSLIVLPVSFFEKEGDPGSKSLHSLLAPLKMQTGEHTLYAVRSSAMVEDNKEQSFAGQFATLLHVRFDQLPAAIEQVRQSGMSERVRSYAAKESHGSIARLAVIVQEMVPATVAGVAFGINPLNGEPEIVINAVAGLGDKLVDGTVNAVSYIVRGEVVEGSDPLLSNTQLLQVASCVQALGSHYQHPQDIEFAFKDDQFYLLQSRPITTIAKGEQIIWDNSNIVESYPGLTSPLTFSFIEKMYDAVYRQFSRVLGVSPAKIDKHSSVYASMLGHLNGRVYYNLNSWYRALAQLPGYSLNAGFMEKMMGVKEKPDVDVSDMVSSSKLAGWRDVGFAVYRILKNLRTARKEKDRFIASFDHIYNQYNSKDYSIVPLAEIWQDYARFEALMVKEWKAPLVNDFFAMIYFGTLQKQCAQYWPEHTDLHNQLLGGSDDIITTEPLKRLPVLASRLSENDELRQYCLQKSSGEVWQRLQQPKYTSILQSINQYIEEWGERCVAELKLETITYKQAPEKLISILQSYIANDIFAYPQSGLAYAQRIEAEQLTAAFFKGRFFKKRIFHHVLKQARYFVSNRENLRYYRTKGFGMVRRMMIGIGEQLKRQERIDEADDVFYLTLKEIETFIQQPFELRTIIDTRRKETDVFRHLELPARVVTTGKPDKAILMPGVAVDHQHTKVLQGTPCSQGFVQGKVCKVNHATDLRSLDGGILATYATDPGYVVLFATSSGILTERGSLLSHAAIVSREMGLPCIVGIDGLMDVLKDGDEILMDGSTGVVKIISSHG